MRARVWSETEPLPLRTLLVVWKLTPERAATSLTEMCRAALRMPTVRVLLRGQANVRPPPAQGGRLEPRSEYPRPRLRRAAWQSLNGEWEFGAGAEPVFDRTILVPFCPECELSGVGERVGDVMWYRRTFEAPDGPHLMLHFGAVDYRATVWVNDVEVARHEGGHSPFSAEITAAARTGENVLVVRAEDPLSDKTIPRGKQHWTETPEGIFYTATTGVWQSVWLEPLPALHVTRLSLVPDLRAGAVDFEVDPGTDLVVTLDGEA